MIPIRKPPKAAAKNRAHLARAAVPSRAQTRQMIINTARRHGVDPRLALAVSWQESGWNQRQVSVANAIGAMQVIPSSGEWASQMAGRKLNLLRTQDNITAGVVILRSLTRSAKNLDQAIAGYYQGLYSVQKNGMYADTKRYVAAIKAHRARMRAGWSVPPVSGLRNDPAADPRHDGPHEGLMSGIGPNST